MGDIVSRQAAVVQSVIETFAERIVNGITSMMELDKLAKCPKYGRDGKRMKEQSKGVDTIWVFGGRQPQRSNGDEQAASHKLTQHSCVQLTIYNNKSIMTTVRPILTVTNNSCTRPRPQRLVSYLSRSNYPGKWLLLSIVGEIGEK